MKLGNFLYNNSFFLYRPMYGVFKRVQDAAEIALLKKYVARGDFVLDVGANIGFYAGILSSLVGKGGSVHCFEPDAKNFRYLSAAVAGLSNVTCVNKAVGPRTEALKIYKSNRLNVDHRTYQPDSYDSEVDIEAVSVDDYLLGPGGPARQANGRVDLIKMDIQGFEMQAIQGMSLTLANNPGVRLISEFWPYGLRKAGNSGTEYWEFLTDRGFTCYVLEKRGLQELDAPRVRAMEGLGEEQYFNIFASRTRV